MQKSPVRKYRFISAGDFFCAEMSLVDGRQVLLKVTINQ
jgi:hypothetical protein